MPALDRRGRWRGFGTFENDAQAVTPFADNSKLGDFAVHLQCSAAAVFQNKAAKRNMIA
jgi:hypothetical protein